MSAVPLLRPRDAIRAFESFGWQVARQKGSHIILTKVGHIATLSIPDHREVARGTLRILISKAGLTVEEFVAAYEGMLGGGWVFHLERLPVPPAAASRGQEPGLRGPFWVWDHRLPHKVEYVLPGINNCGSHRAQCSSTAPLANASIGY